MTQNSRTVECDARATTKNSPTAAIMRPKSFTIGLVASAQSNRPMTRTSNGSRMESMAGLAASVGPVSA